MNEPLLIFILAEVAVKCFQNISNIINFSKLQNTPQNQQKKLYVRHLPHFYFNHFLFYMMWEKIINFFIAVFVYFAKKCYSIWFLPDLQIKNFNSFFLQSRNVNIIVAIYCYQKYVLLSNMHFVLCLLWIC